jgi:RNA polymerase sigma-70 factor (ECF subfamily)
MSGADDKTLVEQAQRDSHAFAVLYDRYVERIYAYAYRQTNEESVAKDVTAVTFEKALRHIRRYRWQGSSFCAWLYRIARNEIAQHYRRQRFLAPWRGRTEAREPATDGRLPELAVQSDERSRQLQAALARLRAKDREIIALRFFEELSSEEVAEILACSTQNVYLRLHRALQRLRQQLDVMEVSGEVKPYVSG